MATTSQKNVILIQSCGHFGLAIHDKIIKNMPANSRLRCGYTKDQQKNVPQVQKCGTETFNLELTDEKCVDACLKEVRDIVLIPPFKPNREELCKTFIDKAVAAGVSRFILISVQGAATGEFPWAKEMFNIEKKLMGSGMNYTILRTSLHQETLCFERETIKNGTFYSPTGEAKLAPICFKDVAELCVKILATPDQGRNKVWEITGPQLFSGKEVASLLSDIIGRNVNFVSDSVDDFKAKLKSWGVSEFKAESIGDLLGWYAKGNGNRTFTDYSTVLGRELGTLKDCVLEHKSEFA